MDRGMRRSFYLSLVTLIGISLSLGCIKRKEWGRSQSDLDRLLLWMTGSFSSQEQAAVDSSFFDIHLEMVPIWTERVDGYWLYVEQAAADAPDRPYRQRIYNLAQLNDSTFRSTVYEIDQPLRFAGAWRAPDQFDSLSPDSLQTRHGCAIILHNEGDSAFAGSTVGAECLSDNRGAAYATSEVRITETYLYTWDRGFDSTGVQVWGADKRGYVFKKVRSQ